MCSQPEMNRNLQSLIRGKALFRGHQPMHAKVKMADETVFLQIIHKNSNFLVYYPRMSLNLLQNCLRNKLGILAINLRENKNIKGVKVNPSEILISQLADDTTLFLCSAEDILNAINCVNEFSNVAGPQLNLSKTEGLCIGSLKGFSFPVCN